ncbi:MAG: diguanylate cyclase (GGDEF)-like protein [Porticoccus sp.]|jgi:diguanylate cyclase (GGDEF)-like protein
MGLSRNKTSNMKFRHQLALIFVVGILVMALITSLAVSNISSKIFRDGQLQQGFQVIESLARQGELSLLYQSRESAKDLVDNALNFPGVKAVTVMLDTGEVLYAGGDEALQSGVHSDEVSLIHEDDNHWVFNAPVLAGKTEDALWEEYSDDGKSERETLGYISVVVGKDALILMEQSILQSNLFISMIIAVILLLLLLGISRRLTNPLEKLSITMKRAEEGDSVIRADLGGPADITDMQHAFNSMMEALESRQQELVRAMSAALESARIKGEFAANVTHELRTPMNAVLGMLDLLMTMGLSPKQLEYVETAKTSGEGLLELIDEILTFSEIDTHNLTIEKEDCYLYELLDEVTGLLANQALKKKIDLGYLAGEQVPSVIHGDASRIRQVLINLLGNAIKFTDIGEVAVYVTVIENADNAPPEQIMLQFEVRDSGIGITVEDQNRIFEAFTQVDSSSTKQYEGTGLGLAISRQIVELMGGHIRVSSEQGNGSSFWFTLPTEIRGAQNTGMTTATTLSGKRALLVDNSPIVRDFGVQQLDRLGIRCDATDSGFKALELIRKMSADDEELDILLIDEDMPGLKGPDFLKLVKEEPSLKDTLIAVLNNPWVTGGLEKMAGMARLNKPLRTTEIKGCLEQLFLGVAEPDEKKTTSKTINKLYSRQRKILVVDDNRPNQKVAIAMLERMGCQCELVDTGKGAVEAVIRNRFDAVLMDCYMPVMNGYDATRQIRMYEGGHDNSSGIPIIAMTANNTQLEVDRCMDAGMDDFLSKPLRIDDLEKMLLKWVPPDEDESTGNEVDDDLFSVRGVDISGFSYDPLVIQELKASVGEVIVSMIEAFLEDTPVYLQSLKHAITENDGRQVRELAHTVKGSASNFGARRVTELAKTIEEKGAIDDLAGVDSLFEQLKGAFATLSKDLQEFIPDSDDADKVRKKSYHILVVDDDRSMRLALKNVFKNEDYVIEEAGNGMQAISMCQRDMPDLVLMDAMMPEVDGFTACERIRQLPKGANTPVLMITALDNEEAIVKAFAAGASDYIPKPIHFAVLKQRVSRLIHANKVEKHVRQLAYHDPLTGLPNRTNLMQQLRVMVNRAQIEEKMVAIMFLDLDRFKMINDTLGHDAGDLLLKAVSERIQRCVRNQDFVARLGGDEFTVVLEGVTDRDIVSKIAGKICDALGQPFVFLQQKMFVTTSIGISVFPDDGQDVGSLMKHADSAMFRAKEHRNGYCFYIKGMEDEMVRRMEVERELRHAAADDELILYYQPQIDTASGKMIGAEALIRWQHPKHGLLSPDTFIPLAEESGLINKISDWVLENACKQLKIWRDNGSEMKMAVNLSSKDLQLEDFRQKISNLIDKYEISPQSLELEITENTLMENPEALESDLNALRKMGLTLAIDDFGSGFSSLNYLKRLPVDVLKIDRMFIRDIDRDENDKAIVSGVVALAKSMGLSTVAEGVETEEQYHLLQQLGCDTCQGYYFGKPVSAADFENAFLHPAFDA